jgi:hypothetical protein
MRVGGVDIETLRSHERAQGRRPRRGQQPAVPPALLHVTNGESAGNTLRQTGLGGAVLPWQDVLHDGPVPDVARPQLLRARAAFLSACGWGARRAILASLERRDAQLVEAIERRAHVVLWFEHDLYDQLQLLDVLALVRASRGSAELIVVGSFPGRPGFRGLGELTAAELETLWPGRRAATPDLVDAAADGWDAFRAPDPRRLARVGHPELPFLGAAVARLLEEFPSRADGLSGTERRALEAIDAGARTPIEAFVAAQDLEPAPFLGDASFFRALAALGRGEARLVETRDGEELPAPPPLGDGQRFVHMPLRLTTTGGRVLEGKADRVELLGVDRWVGGTHVTTERTWRWDPGGGSLRQEPPPPAS